MIASTHSASGDTGDIGEGEQSPERFTGVICYTILQPMCFQLMLLVLLVLLPLVVVMCAVLCWMQWRVPVEEC